MLFRSDPRLLTRVHKEYFGQILGYSVFVVNGEVVRNEVDVDFVAGGNPSRYAYVPENTLWVEYTSPLDAVATAMHECFESELMRAEGMKYSKAHDAACELEKAFRAQYKDGPAPTLQQAEEFLEQLQGEEAEKSAAEKSDEGLIKIPYSQHFPFASKTSLHHTLNVKAGDTVHEGQPLGDSNYTQNGTLAIGKAGAINAALLAASILALSDKKLAGRLADWRKRQTAAIAEAPTG